MTSTDRIPPRRAAKRVNRNDYTTPYYTRLTYSPGLSQNELNEQNEQPQHNTAGDVQIEIVPHGRSTGRVEAEMDESVCP